MEKQINVAYYRVSTQKQGNSGLGLDSQKHLVEGYLQKKPDFEFTEIESGKKCNRVQLINAIDKCKETKGKLIIAKLDRLSRNVHFLSGLMEGKIDFVCCDNPNATPFLLHVLASVAEYEAKIISQRTKEALAAKVRREHESGNTDFKLGGLNKNNSSFKTDSIHYPAMLALRKKAQKEKADMSPFFRQVKNFVNTLISENKSIGDIQRELKRFGFKTVGGSDNWTRVQVKRLVDKLKNELSLDESKNEEVENGLAENSQ